MIDHNCLSVFIGKFTCNAQNTDRLSLNGFKTSFSHLLMVYKRVNSFHYVHIVRMLLSNVQIILPLSQICTYVDLTGIISTYRLKKSDKQNTTLSEQFHNRIRKSIPNTYIHDWSLFSMSKQYKHFLKSFKILRLKTIC